MGKEKFPLGPYPYSGVTQMWQISPTLIDRTAAWRPFSFTIESTKVSIILTSVSVLARVVWWVFEWLGAKDYVSVGIMQNHRTVHRCVGTETRRESQYASAPLPATIFTGSWVSLSRVDAIKISPDDKIRPV